MDSPRVSDNARWSDIYQKEESMEKVTASSLLEQQERLEEAKRTAINDLLDERNILQESTDRRLGEIAGDLKALGYTYPRKKKESIVPYEPGPNGEIPVLPSKKKKK